MSEAKKALTEENLMEVDKDGFQDKDEDSVMETKLDMAEGDGDSGAMTT